MVANSVVNPKLTDCTERAAKLSPPTFLTLVFGGDFYKLMGVKNEWFYERGVKSHAFSRYSVRAKKKKNRRVNGREVWLGVL